MKSPLTNRAARLLTLVVVFLGFLSIADGQRVGPNRSRAVRTGRETPGSRQPSPQPADPQVSASKQTRSYGTTLNANSREAKNLNLLVTSGGSIKPYEEGMRTAKEDYAAFLGRFQSDAQFAQTHVRLRFEDFAPAYFMVLNPSVRNKIGSGLELAKERATLKSYEEILESRAGLDKKAAKAIVNEAKAALKAFHQ